MKFILYSKEKGVYMGEDNTHTTDIDKAKRFNRIGDAMKASDGTFKVFSIL